MNILLKGQPKEEQDFIRSTALPYRIGGPNYTGELKYQVSRLQSIRDIKHVVHPALLCAWIEMCPKTVLGTLLAADDAEEDFWYRVTL